MVRVFWVGERKLASLMETSAQSLIHTYTHTYPHMQRIDTSTNHSNGILKCIYVFLIKKNCSHNTVLLGETVGGGVVISWLG